MLIKCPSCGETAETDMDVAIGRHVICPYCEVKFTYNETCCVELFKTLPLKLPTQKTQDVSYCADGLRLIRQRQRGQEVKPSEVSPDQSACETIPNHLVGAIILCVFLLPAGVAALIYALQVDERKDDGNVTWAKAASRTAGTIVRVGTIVAIAIWSVMFVYFLILGLLSANEERMTLRTINNVMDTLISTQQNL